MSIDKYDQINVDDDERVLDFVRSIEKQEREAVLMSGDSEVGAIITAEQYKWFLDQLDAHIDVENIVKRGNDREGAQSLDEFKKELGE